MKKNSVNYLLKKQYKNYKTKQIITLIPTYLLEKNS